MGSNANKKRKEPNQEKNAFTVPRRAAWYLFRAAVIVAFVVVFAFVAFLYAMDLSNVYIIVTEGLTLRMDCILGDTDPNERYEYFLSDFVDSDPLFVDNVYAEYAIDSYDYRLDINGFSLLPFGASATMTVTERIPYITGSGTANAPSEAVPEWRAGQFDVLCVKIDGRWYIQDVVLTLLDPPEDSRPTPDMSLLTLTPTPAPTTAPPTQDQNPAITGTQSPEPDPTVTGN